MLVKCFEAFTFEFCNVQFSAISKCIKGNERTVNIASSSFVLPAETVVVVHFWGFVFHAQLLLNIVSLCLLGWNIVMYSLLRGMVIIHAISYICTLYLSGNATVIFRISYCFDWMKWPWIFIKKFYLLDLIIHRSMCFQTSVNVQNEIIVEIVPNKLHWTECQPMFFLIRIIELCCIILPLGIKLNCALCNWDHLKSIIQYLVMKVMLIVGWIRTAMVEWEWTDENLVLKYSAL